MQTILVAENEAPLRRLLSDVLKKAGYQVLAAANGQDAVSVAERHGGEVDLLLTDIVMSGMGGADLYAWLKTERPTLRVLFISGYMSREPMEGAFLKKPFTPEELLEKIREVLAGEQAGDAS